MLIAMLAVIRPTIHTKTDQEDPHPRHLLPPLVTKIITNHNSNISSSHRRPLHIKINSDTLPIREMIKHPQEPIKVETITPVSLGLRFTTIQGRDRDPTIHNPHPLLHPRQLIPLVTLSNPSIVAEVAVDRLIPNVQDMSQPEDPDTMKIPDPRPGKIVFFPYE